MSNTPLTVPSLLLPTQETPEPVEKHIDTESRADGKLNFYVQNYGDHGKAQNFINIIRRYTPEIVMWQETGDRHVEMRTIAKETGLTLLDGIGLPGQESTPLMYDKRILRQVANYNKLIHRSVPIKTNSGSTKMMKQKWLIGGIFQIRTSREMFITCSVHYVFNQDHEPNGSIALETSKNIARITKGERHPIIIGGDWNARKDSPRLAPLRAAGYKSAYPHIEDVKWLNAKPEEQRGNKFILTNVTSFPTTSDHPGVIAQGYIK